MRRSIYVLFLRGIMFQGPLISILVKKDYFPAWWFRNIFERYFEVLMNKKCKQNRQIINIAWEKNACYNVYHGRNIENDWQLLSEFSSSIFCKFITSIFLGYSPVLWAKSYGQLGYLIEKQIKMLIQQAVYRSSHQRCSIKNGVLKNFAKLAGKHLCKSLFFNEVAGREHLCQSLFFNKVATLKAATLLKKYSGTGVFLWLLRNF